VYATGNEPQAGIMAAVSVDDRPEKPVLHDDNFDEKRTQNGYRRRIQEQISKSESMISKT